MSVVYVSQSLSQVVLPPVDGFAISPKRVHAQKTATAGNVIRQSSFLHESSAEAVYAGDIDADAALALRQMHEYSSSVVVHHLGRAYDVEMDYQERGYLTGAMVSVTIVFRVVRLRQ